MVSGESSYKEHLGSDTLSRVCRKVGRRVRNDIAHETKTLGIELARDSQAAARWSLASGGEYYCAGAGVGISGFRADLGLGDDFFGSREDAYSETVRQKRWDWYLDDFSARLKPGGKRILMNTRWHEEDVAGRVLEQIERKEIRGRVISISAIAESDDPLGREPGELLCDEPEGYNYGAFLKARQRETSPMMWSALYQQRPAPEKGDYFKADWPQVFGDASIFRLVLLLICRLRSLPTERPRLQLVNRSQIRGPLHPLQCGVKIGRRLTARPIPLATHGRTIHSGQSRQFEHLVRMSACS